MSFSNTEKLLFDNITPNFLEEYEEWSYKSGKSPTTVGIYLRPLRHIINRAMESNNNLITEYPFKKYKIPTPRNIKKSLAKEDLKRIYEYKPLENSVEMFYRDIWLFSYFANGMNMKDICQLKYKSITGGYIEFRRAKTIRTNKDAKPISILITEDLLRIIEKHGNPSKLKNEYIFPALKDSMNEKQQLAAIKQFTKQCNKYIKRVANNVGIELEVTTYTARHSFATILKNAGVAPSFIGESMGHANMRTTENYFGSFETAQQKENISKLKDW